MTSRSKTQLSSLQYWKNPRKKILPNAVSSQSPGRGSSADSFSFLGCLMPQLLTQPMKWDSISKQFFHNFDGEGYYLFYVSDSCFDRQSGQGGKDTHTQTFPPGFAAINTITYITKKARPAQSNFLKVRGQRNNKIASIRSLNSQ